MVFIISACQNQAYIKPDLSLNEENSSRVIVYRPKSDWVGIAIDYKVFAGDVDMGSLSAGGYVDVFVPEDKTPVTVQGYFLGFADGKPGIQELVLEKGQTYYLRFTQKLDSVITVGNTHTVKGGLSLLLVDKQDFELLR